MPQRRCGHGFLPSDPQLERRTLMSRGDLPAVTAAVAVAHGSTARNPFHHDGIDGLVLHRTFVNRLNDRLSISKDRTLRIIQAFQVFASNYKQLPVNPPAPPGASGPTLAGLVSDLKQQVATAEVRREVLSQQATPSTKTSIKRSPLAPLALVPFSLSQIDQMASSLAALPPVASSHGNGTLSPGDPTPAINRAVNAILNAEAETTIHPLLFRKPGNFYLNPHVMYTLSFSGAPASVAPGVFIRGPHGAILPGATLHPHAPN
jgi:hypothetical protein